MPSKNPSTQHVLSFDEREDLSTADRNHHLEPASKSKYECGARRFLTFCEDHKILPEPSEINLCHFISVVGREVKPTTIKTYLTGITCHFKPTFPDIVVYRLSDNVRQTLIGIEKQLSEPTKHANAFTLMDLSIASNAFNSSFDDLLFNTILALGFAALHRLGELVVPDVLKLCNVRKSIRRSTLVISTCGKVAQYTLPYHKGDQKFKSSPVAILRRPNSRLCPVRTLVRYVNLRDDLFPSHSILLIRSNGELPTRSWFISRLQSIFGTTRSGHSLRAGGATALAQSGTALSTIQAIGRWQSDAWKLYVRNHPILNMKEAEDHMPQTGLTVGEHIQFPMNAPLLPEDGRASSRDYPTAPTVGYTGATSTVRSRNTLFSDTEGPPSGDTRAHGVVPGENSPPRQGPSRT